MIVIMGYDGISIHFFPGFVSITIIIFLDYHIRSSRKQKKKK